ALIGFPDASQGIAESLARGNFISQFIVQSWIAGGSFIFGSGQVRWSGNGMANTGLGTGPELGDCALSFFLRQRFAMPALLVLNKRNACAFECPGENDQWLIAEANRREHLDDFFDVMPVDLLRAPTESFETPLEGVQVVSKRGRFALAKAIDVYQCDEI